MNFRRERLARVYHQALEPKMPPSNLFGVRHGRTPRSTTAKRTATLSSSGMSDSEHISDICRQERQRAGALNAFDASAGHRENSVALFFWCCARLRSKDAAMIQIIKVNQSALSESESDVLPLNYSPFGAVKRLFYKDKRDQRRENISDFLVANATICSR